MSRSTKDQYVNDIDRMADRCQLVMDSLEGAAGVDQEFLEKANEAMTLAFVWLGIATA